MRDLLGDVPITERDADRLETLADAIDRADLGVPCRVRGWDYTQAELTVELEGVDPETILAKREQTDIGYTWTVKGYRAIEQVENEEIDEDDPDVCSECGDADATEIQPTAYRREQGLWVHVCADCAEGWTV